MEWNLYVRVGVTKVLDDYAIEKIIDEVNFEIERLSEVMKDRESDRNYLYVMLGKIYGMIHILKIVR